MPLMEWNDKLSVGVREIDEDHKRLIAMLNELFDAMQLGHGKEVLTKTLDGMILYTRTHFAREEKYFEVYSYPDAAAHKAQHDALTKQVLEIQAKYRAGATTVLSLEVLSFLRSWLLKHIMATDKQYGAFLISKGLK